MRYLLLALAILASCSTLNKNMIKKGTYTISGGVYQNQKWEDSLDFNRVSWFKELTLTFDVFLTTIDKGSPFYNWFSEDEKKLVSSCVDSKVSLTYAWDPMQVSRENFYAEMEKIGYERLSIPHFHNNMKMHPNFARVNVYLYKTSLLCRKKLSGEKLVISFPGWNSVTL